MRNRHGHSGSNTRWIKLSAVFACVTALILTSACGGGGHSASSSPTRTWQMGFSSIPPRFNTASVLQGIDIWSQRAEIAAIHEELPWTDLLVNNLTPDDILDRDKVQLVDYLRAKGLKIYFMAELTDGLSRGEEAPQLRALNRSIKDTDVQQAYRDYVLAVNRKLRPEFIGLVAETNLIRAAAPDPSLYPAVVQAANLAAADLLAAGTSATLLYSVQVETAWDRFATSPM